MKKNKNILIIISLLTLWNFIYPLETEEVVASVNGEPILKSELNAAMMLLEQFKDIKMTQKEMLDQLIKNKLILQEANKKGIKVKKEEIDKKLQELKEEFTEEEFKEVLKTQNKTIEDVRKWLEENLIVQKLFQKEVLPKFKIKQEEIKKFYEENSNKFRTPEKIKMRQLIILFKPQKEDEIIAKEKIEKIRKKITNGENFEKLVREYSQDPYTKIKNGDFGIFKKGEMLKDIEDAIFLLKEGECSLPVKTDLGYHIFKLEKKFPDNKFQLKHLLIQIIPGEKAKKLAFQKKEKILEELKKGEDFIELIKKYSDDPDAKETLGETPEIEVDQLAFASPEAEKKIKRLSVGEISEVFETPIGLYLFKIEKKEEGSLIPLNETVKNQIQLYLIEEKWIKTLEKEAIIEIKL